MTISIGEEYDFRIRRGGVANHLCRVRVIKKEQGRPGYGDEFITCRRNDNGTVVFAFADELFPLDK